MGTISTESMYHQKDLAVTPGGKWKKIFDKESLQLASDISLRIRVFQWQSVKLN